jgi:hypothetical protein
VRLPYRSIRTATASLTLLAMPVLNADVALRYEIEIKLNPNLPAQIKQQAMQGMDASVPKEISMKFKNGRGYSSSGQFTSNCDFVKQEITILDLAGKRYATVGFDKFADEMAAAMPRMPQEVTSATAAMKTHIESKVTGQTAAIQGIEGEEHQVEMTVDAPATPNMPQGPMMRIVMHFWMAKASEAMRVPAVRELAGYNLFTVATLNPISSMRKMVQQVPGFGEGFAALMKEFQSGAYVTLRLRMEVFMPMIGAMAKQLPAGNNPFGAGFDAEAPFLEMNQELAEISTASIPDSVFEIPQGYAPVAAADILKDMLSRIQPTAKH